MSPQRVQPHFDPKPVVGQVVLVGYQYTSDPGAELREFTVKAVKRKYFTIDWPFHDESYLVDFSIEDGEMKESRWVSGHSKAWMSREHFLAELAEKNRAIEDDRRLREIRSFFAGYRKFSRDEIERIWTAIQPMLEIANGKEGA